MSGHPLNFLLTSTVTPIRHPFDSDLTGTGCADSGMPTERFPTHRRPNLSRLDPFKDQIATMRKQQWPYRKIMEWLADEGIAIAYEPLRKFCLRRGIADGSSSKRPTRSRSAKQPSPSPPEVADEPTTRIFRYDDSQPIQTRKNQI